MTFTREPIEVGPGRCLRKLHPIPKQSLFLEIEPSIPPSPLVQQIEDGLYLKTIADLALINDRIEDHLEAKSPTGSSLYYEVIFEQQVLDSVSATQPLKGPKIS